MIAITVAMVLVVAIVLGTLGLVFVGMEGRGRSRVPRLADRMSRAARHLNGEAQTPRSFTRIFG